jgi:hypothetical protein
MFNSLYLYTYSVYSEDKSNMASWKMHHFGSIIFAASHVWLLMGIRRGNLTMFVSQTMDGDVAPKRSTMHGRTVTLWILMLSELGMGQNYVANPWIVAWLVQL